MQYLGKVKQHNFCTSDARDGGCNTHSDNFPSTQGEARSGADEGKSDQGQLELE